MPLSSHGGLYRLEDVAAVKKDAPLAPRARRARFSYERARKWLNAGKLKKAGWDDGFLLKPIRAAASLAEDAETKKVQMRYS